MLTRSNPVEVRAERQLRPTNKGGAALPRSRDHRTKSAFPAKSFRALLQGPLTFNHTLRKAVRVLVMLRMRKERS
jgi:hypothetical protein